MSANQTWFRIDPKRRSRVFFVLLAFTVGLMVALQFIGAPLQTEAASAGIISFEFAGTVSTARVMIESWGSQGRVSAGLSLGLDYLFLFAYSVTIALGCSIVADKLHVRFKILIRLGKLLAWAQYLAAALDAIENYALIRVLLGSENAIWPSVAFWSAGPKFVIVLLGILYIIVGTLITLLSGNRTARSSSS
jgi:hypothetical protein